jgi:hypothetical protein
VAVFPRGGALTAWGNAYLLGRASLDEADVHTVGDDALHRVVGVPGEPDPVPVSIALARLRGLGVGALRLVVPESGDPTGLPGPPATTSAAVAAREAVLTVAPREVPAFALVPTSTPSAEGLLVCWDVLVAEASTPPHGLPTLSEAERGLAETMRSATVSLDARDVASGREELAPRLAGLDRALRTLVLPPSMPARVQRLVVTATRLLALLTWAAETDGGAVSAGEAAQRSAALRPLRQAARYALAAAYSADAEPADIGWGPAR